MKYVSVVPLEVLDSVYYDVQISQQVTLCPVIRFTTNIWSDSDNLPTVKNYCDEAIGWVELWKFHDGNTGFVPEELLLKIAGSSQELCYACVNYMSKEICVMYDYVADSLFGKMSITSYEIPLSHLEHDCETKQVDVCEDSISVAIHIQIVRWFVITSCLCSIGNVFIMSVCVSVYVCVCLSVCLSVWGITFEPFDIETSFLV